MKLICYLTFFLSSSFLNAQTVGDYPAYPTQFDKFINTPSVQWAFYANDTLRFSKFNLSAYLRKKMHQKKIMAAYPMGSGTEQANKIKYNKEDFVYLNYPSCELMIYDSLGNPPSRVFEERKPYNENDSLVFNLLDVVQILFVEKDKMQSYIPWVAPKVPITTSTGFLLGLKDYFNTIINLNYNFISGSNDQCVQLETTTRRIKIDSIPRCDKLKQLYGRNLIETIWAGLLKGKNEVKDIKSNKKLSTDSLKYFSIAKPETYPQYNANGEVSSYRTVYEPTPPSVFKEVEISQNLYYNVTKNIVTSTIPEIVLYAKREGENELSPIIKVVFK